MGHNVIKYWIILAVHVVLLSCSCYARKQKQNHTMLAVLSSDAISKPNAYKGTYTYIKGHILKPWSVEQSARFAQLSPESEPQLSTFVIKTPGSYLISCLITFDEHVDPVNHTVHAYYVEVVGHIEHICVGLTVKTRTKERTLPSCQVNFLTIVEKAPITLIVKSSGWDANMYMEDNASYLSIQKL